MILYMSIDDGTLYQSVDEPDVFAEVDVDEPVTLTPEECCGHDGRIVEILIAAGKARMVKE